MARSMEALPSDRREIPAGAWCRTDADSATALPNQIAARDACGSPCENIDTEDQSAIRFAEQGRETLGMLVDDNRSIDIEITIRPLPEEITGGRNCANGNGTATRTDRSSAHDARFAACGRGSAQGECALFLIEVRIERLLRRDKVTVLTDVVAPSLHARNSYPLFALASKLTERPQAPVSDPDCRLMTPPAAGTAPTMSVQAVRNWGTTVMRA